MCGGENGTNGSQFLVFSEDIAFSLHFMAPRTPYRSANGLAMPVKELSKIGEIPVSYPMYVVYSNYFE